MDVTLQMETAVSPAAREADEEFAQDVAEMDRILLLVAAEFDRRFGREGAGVPHLCASEDRSLREEYRTALIACCRTVRERRLANPELIRGLELMVGDLSRDQLAGFLARLPSPPTPPRRRRVGR